MILSLLSRLFCVALVSQLCNSQRCTTQNGENCVFPFEYENKIYRACSTENKVKQGKSWCSTNVDGNGKYLKGNWGYCSSDCPVDGEQECNEGNQCVYRDDCPQYQEFSKLPKSHPDYTIQRNKWRTNICNRKERRLCCPVISTPTTTDGVQECTEGSQCVYRDDCPQFQEFLSSEKSRDKIQKWRSRVCNKKEKRLCCQDTVPVPVPSTDDLCKENPQFPGGYLPRLGVDRCGKDCITESQVSGGVNVKLGEFPWAALLGYTVRKRRWDYTCQCQKLVVITKYRCGGTLINNRYVLTAAHCHEGSSKVSTVVLGEWDVGVDPDCPPKGECLPPKQSMKIESVTIHENYIRNTRTGEVLNDIALIRLKQPVLFNKSVQPICLPLNENKAAKDIGADNLYGGIVDRFATVIGWGANGSFHEEATIGNETVPIQILQKVDIPIISNEDCKSRLSDLNQENVDKIILPTHVCAGQKDSNKDTCKGDSGGGMFIKEKTGEDSIYHQIGLVSFGLTRLCGIGYSGVYTRITEFIPWITQNIHD